uniref:Uncharacterized protein LOC114326575 n=1 Tax=Diabrotica virgifera virgifera TaxID=50390 RepID=A0A6P7F508_DIAVI
MYKSHSSDCEALKWCATQTCMDVAIISDSKSALQAISSHPINQFRNALILNIKKLIMDHKQNNVTVSFIWTKGHCGVEGNEVADIAAKSTHSCHHIDKVFNLEDLNNALKPNIRRKWETDYKRNANKSTNHYFS